MASESGTAQTSRKAGVVGAAVETKVASRMVLKSLSIEGASPVGKSDQCLAEFLSTTGHANPVGSWGAHSPRLNTFDDR